MPRPPAILFDTDVLIQIFLTGEIRLLRLLNGDYGVQAGVVPEVEIEVCGPMSSPHRFDAEFQKAVRNGTLEVFDEGRIRRQLIAPDSHAAGVATTGLSTIQADGRSLNLIVDRGEAYTFATCIALGIPAVSNDFSAIKALKKAGRSVPSPVLRFLIS